ncbi:MAG: hypothetical protein ACJAS1_004048 [Oleiphilaceae bacterium]|jgi:hypothetical protein
MRNYKRASFKQCLTISILALGLAGCGGSGSSTTTTTGAVGVDGVEGLEGSQGISTLVEKLAPGTGKLIIDVRSTGYSERYETDAAYKGMVDVVISAASETLGEVGGQIKWPKDIPSIFSGCGTVNAFFVALTPDLVNAMETQTDASNVATKFGETIKDSSALVVCHEYSEKIVSTLMDPGSKATIQTAFNIESDDDINDAIGITSFFLVMQGALHEVGHALDGLLLKDPDNTVKSQFQIPVANVCGTAPCSSIKEDFGDWIQSAILIEAIKDEIEEDPESTERYLNVFKLSVTAWQSLFPDNVNSPGDGKHSTTEARQYNMLCWAYGAIPEFRTADLDSGGKIGTLLATKLGDIATCEQSYAANEILTETLLGEYVNNED